MSSSSGSKIQFYTHKMCPFAQRVWIALEAKSLQYDLQEIDLYGRKPAWFMKLNPAGLVPVVKVGDTVVPESNDIIDFLETCGGQPLVPATAALDEINDWRRFLDEELGPAAKAVVLSGGDGSDKESKYYGALLKMEERLGGGEFLLGKTFSAADCSFAPFLQRISEHLYVPEEVPKLREYLKSLLSHPAVQATVVEQWWWWW